MYKLVNGQLLQIIEVVTPNQTSLITTTVCPVIGYDSDVPIDFETMPEKEDQPGKTAELHYIEGNLVWVYVDPPKAPDINIIAAELVKQELSSLDLQKQNEVIGAEMVKKDLAIYDLTMQNQVLGSMLSALELKIKANEGGTTNV
ncbi:hypothetical protein D3C76_180060 [compost metagenome]